MSHFLLFTAEVYLSAQFIQFLLPKTINLQRVRNVLGQLLFAFLHKPDWPFWSCFIDLIVHQGMQSSWSALNDLSKGFPLVVLECMPLSSFGCQQQSLLSMELLEYIRTFPADHLYTKSCSSVFQLYQAPVL